jgi:hypothetical protein
MTVDYHPAKTATLCTLRAFLHSQDPMRPFDHAQLEQPETNGRLRNAMLSVNAPLSPFRRDHSKWRAAKLVIDANKT